MTEHGTRCDVTGLVTTEAVIGVDWASGPDITAWVEVTPRGIRQHYAQEGRPTEADYRANARHWWARDWGRLTRRERRRLCRIPALFAMHKAWSVMRAEWIRCAWADPSDRSLDAELERLKTEVHTITGVPDSWRTKEGT